ncbi:unnamed protein product [Lota lota]
MINTYDLLTEEKRIPSAAAFLDEPGRGAQEEPRRSPGGAQEEPRSGGTKAAVAIRSLSAGFAVTRGQPVGLTDASPPGLSLCLPRRPPQSPRGRAKACPSNTGAAAKAEIAVTASPPCDVWPGAKDFPWSHSPRETTALTARPTTFRHL